MDTVLLVITLISAATAIVALASARRVRRHERERSEARVAALASAAETHGGTDGGWTSVAGEWQWNPNAEGIRDSGFGISAARASREARVIPVTERIPNPQSQITESRRTDFVRRDCSVPFSVRSRQEAGCHYSRRRR